jgi:hypothetical protein
VIDAVEQVLTDMRRRNETLAYAGGECDSGRCSGVELTGLGRLCVSRSTTILTTICLCLATCGLVRRRPGSPSSCMNALLRTPMNCQPKAGVKGSQVQILSARQSTNRGRSGEIRTGPWLLSGLV